MSAITMVSEHIPDLAHHVSSITVRPKRPFPEKASSVMDKDELFMLQFINAGGRYMWPFSPEHVGDIEIDYTPYVDFLTALLLHELAHAMQRSKDPEALRRARSTGSRLNKHHQEWSNDAVKLYRIFGCEKAGIFSDGMSYRSTRERHARMVPSERAWLYHAWGHFDSQTFGTLRPEFERLFAII